MLIGPQIHPSRNVFGEALETCGEQLPAPIAAELEGSRRAGPAARGCA